MGVNHSKINTNKILVTPQKKVQSNVKMVTAFAETIEMDETSLDPRSPHICRTPINEMIRQNHAITKIQDLTQISKIDNTSAVLRARFARELGDYNLMDPRSPSLNIDRTPLYFDDSNHPVYANWVVDEETEVGATIQSDSMLGNPYTPDKTLQQIPKNEAVTELDPRSPTIGVERTPLVFGEELPVQESVDEVGLDPLKCTITIENKPLERIKNPRTKITPKSIKNNAIYQDKEQVLWTPKRNLTSTPKRTPLGCVANKSHLRSKSVENTGNALKPRITSYDDSTIKSPIVSKFSSNGENIAPKKVSK